MFRDQVGFEVDPGARPKLAQPRDLEGVRHQRHREDVAPTAFTVRLTPSIGDRALAGEKARHHGGCRDLDGQRITPLRRVRPRADAVDVSGHQVPAQGITNAQRPLEVNHVARAAGPQRRQRQGLGAEIRLETRPRRPTRVRHTPSTAMVPPLRQLRQGQRRRDRDAAPAQGERAERFSYQWFQRCQ